MNQPTRKWFELRLSTILLLVVIATLSIHSIIQRIQYRTELERLQRELEDLNELVSIQRALPRLQITRAENARTLGPNHPAAAELTREIENQQARQKELLQRYDID